MNSHYNNLPNNYDFKDATFDNLLSVPHSAFIKKSLIDLPSDILDLIMQQCDLHSLIQLNAVSKTINNDPLQMIKKYKEFEGIAAEIEGAHFNIKKLQNKIKKIRSFNHLQLLLLAITVAGIGLSFFGGEKEHNRQDEIFDSLNTTMTPYPAWNSSGNSSCLDAYLYRHLVNNQSHSLSIELRRECATDDFYPALYSACLDLCNGYTNSYTLIIFAIISLIFLPMLAVGGVVKMYQRSSEINNLEASIKLIEREISSEYKIIGRTLRDASKNVNLPAEQSALTTVSANLESNTITHREAPTSLTLGNNPQRLFNQVNRLSTSIAIDEEPEVLDEDNYQTLIRTESEAQSFTRR
jgi:hypothetical protein